MATIINTPGREVTESDSSLGIVFGVILAIGLIVLFIIYGIPALRNSSTSNGGLNVNVTTPGGTSSGSGGSSGSPAY